MSIQPNNCVISHKRNSVHSWPIWTSVFVHMQIGFKKNRVVTSSPHAKSTQTKEMHRESYNQEVNHHWTMYTINMDCDATIVTNPSGDLEATNCWRRHAYTAISLKNHRTRRLYIHWNCIEFSARNLRCDIRIRDPTPIWGIREVTLTQKRTQLTFSVRWMTTISGDLL